MLPVLHDQVTKSNEYIDKIFVLSQEIYCHIGWHDLHYRIFQDILYSFETPLRDLYIPFLYLLSDGIYTTRTCEDFADFLIISCQDSFTSLKFMCIILERFARTLQLFLAI
jgi:hypothetical protein